MNTVIACRRTKTAMAGRLIDRSNHLSAKTVGEIMLKVLKQKISDAAAWIDVKLHWIWAVQLGSMEGASTVLISSVPAKVRVSLLR